MNFDIVSKKRKELKFISRSYATYQKLTTLFKSIWSMSVQVFGDKLSVHSTYLNFYCFSFYLEIETKD